MADPAIADDDGVLAERRGRRRFAFLRRRWPGGPGVQAVTGRGRRCGWRQPINQSEQQRIDDDRQDRTGEHQIACRLRHHPECNAEAGKDEGEFADLGEAGGNGPCGGG
jgi:hypothetical protein